MTVDSAVRRRVARLGRGMLALLVGLVSVPSVRARADVPTVKVRVTGLFSPAREADLRALLKEWPGVELAGLDFDRAEATFRFDPAKLFPNVKPAEVVARLDEKLRGASNGTFGVRPPSAVPRAKLDRVEIPVAGLDCKACCLAAYEIVARVEGVEQATASFKEGRVTALIDPKKTDKAALEAALRQHGVTVR